MFHFGIEKIIHDYSYRLKEVRERHKEHENECINAFTSKCEL
jgi:hypothetical protein